MINIEQSFETHAAHAPQDERDREKWLKSSLKHLPQYKTHTAAFERILEIYRPQALELKVGDKVLWNRNVKKEGICNGQRATLTAIHGKELCFKLEDNQDMTLPKEHPALKHLDHGYVLTNYKVQGKDAAYAVGLMESQHRFSATLKNFYVQISRAVHEMTLVTDNKEHLIAAIMSLDTQYNVNTYIFSHN